MMTKTYFLDNTPEVHNVISYIESNVMCFTEYKHCPKNDVIEYTVKLRAEDVPYLETLLAPVV